MTEREQLELAAKACGIELWPSDPYRDSCGNQGLLLKSGYSLWNPATNQIDSDRIGAKLRMNVEWGNDYVMVYATELPEYFTESLEHNNDENAALMAARMKCAVAIGEGMK